MRKHRRSLFRNLNFVFALIFKSSAALHGRYSELRAIMIISWSDNGTRSYSYELSGASRWEKRTGARRSADFTLEKSGNGAGKEELRSRRRLSNNAKKLPKERERDEEKEATRRGGEWKTESEKAREDEKYGSERGKVKFRRARKKTLDGMDHVERETP